MAALVMIVDNEKGLLTLFSSLIRRLGYDIVQADGGQPAIEFLEQETPDLLILDMAMPVVSGEDVLHYVCSEPRLDTMRVVVLTALGPSPMADGVAARISRWIVKPIDPQSFLEIVRDLVEK